MVSSFPLAAYLATSRHGEAQRTPDLTIPRPSGTLIWLHSAEPSRAQALVDLGLRIAAQRDARVLLTVPPQTELPANLTGDVIITHAPTEHQVNVDAFLDHWSPDALLWLGPWLRPAVLRASKSQGIPLVLIDAAELGLEHKRLRWLPEPLGATFRLFDIIFTRTPDIALRLKRMTGQQTRVLESGILLEESPVLRCNEDDLSALGETLAARPCWLAARIQLDEIDLVLAAQKGISRLSPRMLLILVPENLIDAPEIRARLRSRGLNVAPWDDGEFPSEKTDVLLAENRKELGLFYRIAPITLLGSSLMPGHGGRNPLMPAALGSAVLYGPGVRHHLDAYARLARAKGARIVKDAPSIITALEELMAPDKVAEMVHAGWDTVSQGAGVINQIVEEVGHLLDKEEAQA